jgi:hypothetical protein
LDIKRTQLISTPQLPKLSAGRQPEHAVDARQLINTTTSAKRRTTDEQLCKE